MQIKMSGMGKKVIAILLLSALGLLGNIFTLPIGFSVNFLFGSIFVIISCYFLGMGAGIITSLITSSYTYILWNHPYAILIFTAEIIWLTLQVQRKRKNIILSDAVFWFVLGLPLIFLFYYFIMSLGMQATLIIFLKQSVNGIFNAMIASILIYHTPLARAFGIEKHQAEKVPFSLLIFHLTTLFLMIPSLTLALASNFSELAHYRQMFEDTAVSEVHEAKSNLENWLDRMTLGVDIIAKKGLEYGFQPSSGLQRDLKFIKSVYPDFHNIYVADSLAVTKGFYPPVNERGQSTIGLDFSDRA